jgi:hypothetical protein
MTQTEFESSIPSSEPSQTHMLHREAAGITKVWINNNLIGRTYCVIEEMFQIFFWGGLRRNRKTLGITRAQNHHEYNSRALGDTSLLGKHLYWQYLTLHNELKLLHAVPISNYCHKVCCLASTKIVPLSTELHERYHFTSWHAQSPRTRYPQDSVRRSCK